MNSAKINDFELASLEAARIRFQENISSLIEIEAELDRKNQSAKSKGKDVIFIDVEEAELLTKHLLTTTAELLSSYDHINHAAKHLIFRHRIVSRMEYKAA